MKAIGAFFKMDMFVNMASNSESTEIVGNAGLFANICETRFRSVIGKPLDKVGVEDLDWKINGFKEDIQNMWSPHGDLFLRALRDAPNMINKPPSLSITGGNNTLFSA